VRPETVSKNALLKELKVLSNIKGNAPKIPAITQPNAVITSASLR